ncbi:TRAUB-domain-containing protein [Ophiobolus disseminans]|uniref:Protein BFR2 n=1 Tax=Ophiobolus disseminans TaxID=1469910 RepID=A0A6A6ZW35_9PLEO|nr:TRAUB-domain-containing protein [Ophiobolus disseminans]
MKKSKITDFDPESLLNPAPSSSSNEQSDADLSDVEDANEGREHYTVVGKSKLRQKADAPDAPLYKGRTISRNELDDSDSDSDDPFVKGFNEDDSEEDIDEDGVNRLKIGEDESEEDDMDGEMDQDDEMDSADEDDKDDEGSGSSDEEAGDDANADASAVRNLMQDTKAFTSTLAAGAQSDVAKGQAVKTQRTTFDTLLNTRIRLQKALISTNSSAAEPYKQATAQASSIQAAEAAALKLLGNLTDLRISLEEARTGSKRKRPTFDTSTPSSEIWSSISSSERSALPHRKAVLERWSTKTRATTVTNAKNRLNASATQTLTEVLDAQMTSSHLVTRTQIPRSCAPIQSNASNKGSAPIPEIYDDADFYGLMLKELLEQRSADSASGGAAEFVVAAPWQVAREAKTKKIVDTKASKGRRLRYTVQEKLQNFMAPEERGEWGERQRDELFSSLFGQRMALGEQDDVESEAEEDGVDAQEAGLMLFRS